MSDLTCFDGQNKLFPNFTWQDEGIAFLFISTGRWIKKRKLLSWCAFFH